MLTPLLELRFFTYKESIKESLPSTLLPLVWTHLCTEVYYIFIQLYIYICVYACVTMYMQNVSLSKTFISTRQNVESENYWKCVTHFITVLQNYITLFKSGCICNRLHTWKNRLDHMSLHTKKVTVSCQEVHVEIRNDKD